MYDIWPVDGYADNNVPPEQKQEGDHPGVNNIHHEIQQQNFVVGFCVLIIGFSKTVQQVYIAMPYRIWNKNEPAVGKELLPFLKRDIFE